MGMCTTERCVSCRCLGSGDELIVVALSQTWEDLKRQGLL